MLDFVQCDPCAYREAFASRSIIQPEPNPVVKTTALHDYPGWRVREYANGVFDATNGSALTIGAHSFAEAVVEVHLLTFVPKV
jgi:hypothetical protein